jgi:hypothetical protein
VKIAATLLAYLLSLVLVAAVALVVVLFVAGPHSGLLPQWAEAIVLALGWIAVLVLPVFPARAVWRRMSR